MPEFDKQTSNLAAVELTADLMSSATRTSRRTLYATSLLLFVLVWGHIEPEQIDFLGLKFKELSNRAIMQIMLFVLVFNLLSFAFYMIADYVRYRHLRDQFKLKYAVGMWNSMVPPDDEPNNFEDETGYKEDFFPSRWALVVARSRAILDFFFPLAAGVFAIISAIHFLCTEAKLVRQSTTGERTFPKRLLRAPLPIRLEPEPQTPRHAAQ